MAVRQLTKEENQERKPAMQEVKNKISIVVLRPSKRGGEAESGHASGGTGEAGEEGTRESAVGGERGRDEGRTETDAGKYWGVEHTTAVSHRNHEASGTLPAPGSAADGVQLDAA